MSSQGGPKKSKSTTNLMKKFVQKFTKKKRTKGPPSNQTSREKSSESHSKGKRVQRSTSKSKLSVQANKNDVCEVTAKERERPEKKEKKVEKKASTKKEEKSRDLEKSQKSLKIVPLRSAESQMVISQAISQKVEKAAKLWMEAMEKCGGDVKRCLENDYKPIDNHKVEEDKCSVFLKNLDLCQSDNLELLDANRVKIPDGDVFYHGSVITIPYIGPKVILAQLPLRESPSSMEAFWLMVAALKIQRVYVLLGPDELDKKAMNDYFPDDFVEHKTIRVNNRKTALKNDEQMNDQLYYEVVPKECAEAPFAMMEICDFWPDAKIPTQTTRPVATVGSVFESDIDADATIGVVSHFGAGRAGAFLVASVAIERMRCGEPPNIRDIAMSVRTQRPGAVETFSQYVFVHVLALSYTLKHIGHGGGLKGKIEKLIGQLEQLAFEKLAEETEDSVASTTVE